VRDELLAFIELIRNRTTNTVEEWNLMLQAERALEREGTEQCEGTEPTVVNDPDEVVTIDPVNRAMFYSACKSTYVYDWAALGREEQKCAT